MKRIFFQSNQLSVRGTEVALYDYARYNREILGNESIIVHNIRSPHNNAGVVEKFRREFPVYGYEDFSEVDRLIEKEKADLFYSIKAGLRDGIVSKQVPSMIHAVFPVAASQFHGSAYAFVSEWLAAACSNRRASAVPHIVTLPKVEGDLRAELGIPAHAMVFGCHGGADSFDLDFAKKAVQSAVDKRSDVYFVFLNIAPFAEHERVIFLPATADMDDKVRFINTCNAMLHARKRGETFGLAIAEFSLCNKPVLTYALSGERHHIDVLGEKAFLYRGPKSLLALLLALRPSDLKDREWDCYSALFSPARIMRRFQDVFIDTALRRGVQEDSDITLDWVDRLAVQARKLDRRLVKLSRVLPG